MALFRFFVLDIDSGKDPGHRGPFVSFAKLEEENVKM